MPFRALTFDFWNTIVDASTNSQVRRRVRTDHLHRVAARYGARAADVDRAQTNASNWFVERWKQDHRTLGSDELVAHIWGVLGLEVDPEDHAATVTRFEESLFDGPPALTPGIAETLAACAGRFRIGLISDTMFSPGRVLRRFLDAYGLLEHFDVFVFSDETGCSKPHPRAFEKALSGLDAPADACLHIGDLRRTDIAGAQGAGLRAALYTGVREDEERTPEPDHVLRHWADLERVLDTRLVA